MSQLRFLFAKHPDVAKKFRSDYPDQNLKNLPQHVSDEDGDEEEAPVKKKRPPFMKGMK